MKTIAIKIQRIGILVLLLIATIGFISCDDQDDHSIYRDLIGDTYFGDLYFNYNGRPVVSYITFKANDYAYDEQYYANSGYKATTLDVRWWVNNGTLFLAYGRNLPMLEIRNVNVGNLYLFGDLYSLGRSLNRIE